MINTIINWLQIMEKVQTPEGKNHLRGPYYRCICHRCGNETYVTTSGDLRSGRILSCGCWRNSQEFADARAIHGARRQKKGTTTRTYNIWCGIKKCCENPQATNYYWYGMAGVTICERWQDFRNFLADMGDCPEGLEIDRINPAKGYEPDNCRWTTHKENCNNRRENQ